LPVKVNLDIIKNAEIVRTKDTVKYLIRLKATAVKTLLFHFSDFFLSKNATITIYTNKEIT